MTNTAKLLLSSWRLIGDWQIIWRSICESLVVRLLDKPILSYIIICYPNTIHSLGSLCMVEIPVKIECCVDTLDQTRLRDVQVKSQISTAIIIVEHNLNMLVWLFLCLITACILMFSCVAPCESTYHTQKSLHRHQNKCEIFFAVQAVRLEQRREMKSREKQLRAKGKQKEVSSLHLTKAKHVTEEDTRYLWLNL